MNALTPVIQGSSALTIMALGAFHCYQRYAENKDDATPAAEPIKAWKNNTIARIGLAHPWPHHSTLLLCSGSSWTLLTHACSWNPPSSDQRENSAFRLRGLLDRRQKQSRK